MHYEFSCHTWGFNDLTLVEALATIARLGFRYVDIGTGNHLNLAELAKARIRHNFVPELSEYLEEFNLQVADVYLMLPRISVADDQKRETDLALFKVLLPIAKAVGSRGVTVSTGLVHSEEDVSALSRTITSLQQMYEIAESHEMPLSIEPHIESMAQTPEQALRILDEIQGLDVTLDWAQMVYQKVSHAQIKTLLPRTRHIHIRQAKINQLQVPYHKGTIKPDAVLASLQDAEYDGIICVEYMQDNKQNKPIIDPLVECTAMRDALRDARDAIKGTLA